MRPGEAPSKRLQTWNSNRAPCNLEVQGVSLSLRGHTFSSLDGSGVGGRGGAKFPGLFLPQGGPIQTSYLMVSISWAHPQRQLRMPPLPPSPPALNPTPPQPTPAGKSDLLVSQKTSKANVPALRPDVHSWAALPHPHPSPVVPAGTSGPRGRGRARDFQSPVSQPRGRKGSPGFPLVPLPPRSP